MSVEPTDWKALRDRATELLAAQGIENPAQCAHSTTEIRCKRDALGRQRFKRQCLACGRSAGDQLKHRDVEQQAGPLERVPPWDEQRERDSDNATTEYYSALRLMQDDLLGAEHDQWLARYDDYLASPEWQARRGKVLERAGGLCEGCRRRRATQVHHLSYKHVGHEFLWELVAICRDCHERCHKSQSEPQP